MASSYPSRLGDNLCPRCRKRPRYATANQTDTYCKPCRREYMAERSADRAAGIPGVVRLSECTPDQRRLITAILNAKKAADSLAALTPAEREMVEGVTRAESER